MKPARVALLVFVTAAFFFQGLLPASASFAWRFAGGRALYDAPGGDYLAYGVAGNSYMYPKQSPSQDNDWVNSVYARKDDGSYIEAGWYWTPGGSSRVWFTKAYSIDYGDFGERYFTVDGRPDGTRATVTVRLFSTTADYHAVWVDNQLKYEWNALPFRITSCRADVGAERYDTGDYNRGSWTYARVANSSLGWGYWPNARAIPPAPPVELDPYYHFYSNYVDRSDHFVYVDANQN